MTAFPTGVAIITTVGPDGSPWGLTTNAVSSVSADPPTLLVCIAKTSRTLPAVLERKGFSVNFMAVGSAEVCARFASSASAEEKFAPTEWELSGAGHPCLSADAVAFTDCETMAEIDGGSHLILVGRVTDGGVIEAGREPLVYFRREYRAFGA